MVTAVVVAAGMSTRMGQNKLLLEFRNKPLITQTVDTLLASAIDEVVVVLGHEAEKVRMQIAGKPLKLVENPDYREGLSTSVRVGVEAASPQSKAIMVCLADQPLLQPDDVNRLVEAFTYAKKAGKSIVVPFYNGERGNPVVLDSSYREAILGIVGDVGCRGVIKRYPDKVFALEMETDHVVRDVDNLEDYRTIRASA